MKNLEVFEKDPRTHTLLNQGVAKVTSGRSSAELDTLRYELANFVCDGQYAAGMVRILQSFLGHQDKSEQPGVWVSGFFGSGKSHLVKMLQYLWLDFEFKDGAKARGLAKLPPAVTDALKELSTAARRKGGLHAAAGTLGAGSNAESLRLELLSIVFRSVGLPDQPSRAGFLLWLRDEGMEEAVRRFVERQGGDFDAELTNLYVSDLMAKAILDVRPDFASKPADVRLLLQKQFPNVADVSIDEMLSWIKKALIRNKKLPLTLIILDEVQQYIGEDVRRSKDVQDLQERCCSNLGADFMFVATGQNALSGVPLLQRLQGRFPVTVELQDTDVEQVTREVVLKKKATAEAVLKQLLDKHSGEIERQLTHSKIAFDAKDRELLVQDYPILPVRRRFWERVLRAVDKAGTGAQLRTQLWIVYDAVKNTAEAPLGTVVDGAFLYEHIKTKVLQAGILLQEISETIARQQQEEHGELRYRICSLIFLIGQLPHQGPADTGIRADAETLADLLVTDLARSSGELRKLVPALLEKLVASGAIMQVEQEYRMQTREGSEWTRTFVEARNRFLGDAAKLGGERSQLLRSQCTEIVKRHKPVHGASKEPRKIELRFDDAPPITDGTTIPLWIRDGWDVDESTVLSEARAAGEDAAIVYGFIPKTHAEDLKLAVAAYYAATTTLQAKGNPSGSEGIDARKSMETRQEQAEHNRNVLLTEILNGTKIFLAGGEEIGGGLLLQKLQEAAGRCMDRLFPQFHVADSADWHKVIERVRRGDGDALAAIGHKGDPHGHPVCKAVQDFIGSGSNGKKGTEIRKHFGGKKFGWPQDAVDAALLVLFDAGTILVRSGSEALAKGKLDQKTIPAAEFRCETVTLSKVQLIALRALFKTVGLNVPAGEEAAYADKFLARLIEWAQAAGGAEPLPVQPETRHLAEILGQTGNQRLKALHDLRDELSRQAAEWKAVGERIRQRLPAWEQLVELLKFADGLPVAAEVQAEADAIAHGRRLTADPDPVPGWVGKLTEALRGALNVAFARLESEFAAHLERLEAQPAWERLEPDQRFAIREKCEIRVLPTIEVGSTEEILATLRRTPRSDLGMRLDALPTRFGNAAAEAARLLEPKARRLSLPAATIKDEAGLKNWLADVERLISEKLKDGPVIL